MEVNGGRPLVSVAPEASAEEVAAITAALSVLFEERSIEEL